MTNKPYYHDMNWSELMALSRIIDKEVRKAEKQGNEYEMSEYVDFKMYIAFCCNRYQNEIDTDKEFHGSNYRAWALKATYNEMVNYASQLLHVQKLALMRKELSKFEDLWQSINDMWNECEVDLSEDYPFSGCFSEMQAEVALWVETSRENLKDEMR